jgi:Ca2+-binding RTX toxin-like protein
MPDKLQIRLDHQFSRKMFQLETKPSKNGQLFTVNAFATMFSPVVLELIEFEFWREKMRLETGNMINAVGGDGNDRLIGTNDDDTLFGGDGDDFLTGRGGNDTLDGGMGRDGMFGGAGDDYLAGNFGDDVLHGQRGNDALYGGDGNDRVLGGAGDDIMDGGLENDVIGDVLGASRIANSGNDTIYGGGGNDQIFIYRSAWTRAAESLTIDAGGEHDRVTYVNGRADHALIDLSYGDDRIDLRDVGTGTVDLYVGEGTDTIGVAMHASPAGGAQVVVHDFNEGEDFIDLTPMLGSLENWDGSNPFASGHLRLVEDGGAVILQVDYDGNGASKDFCDLLRLENVELSKLSMVNFPGISTQGVTIVGDSSDERITGTEFDDSIRGWDGNDVLFGLGGNDLLVGDFGNDVLIGGTGADGMYGGKGNDSYNVDNVGDFIVEDARSGIDAVFSSIDYRLPGTVENLYLNVPDSAAITGIGNAGNNYMEGNGLDNQLYGLGGNDRINGGNGNDLLAGYSGDDILRGEAGNDILRGGAGYDQMDGGIGADRYVFQDGESGADVPDLIKFNRFEGDRIDLRGIDAIESDGDDAFTFIGTAAFSNTAGELRFEQNGAISTIYGDINGDGIADFALIADGSGPMQASDFLF